jgi:hypothetical protein
MSVSITTGPDAGLVNLSQGGALLEVAGRLSLGSAVRLKLTKAGSDIATVNGKVAWQRVASITSGQINYRIAVAFDVPLDAAVVADGEAPAPPAAEEPAEPEPERSPAVVQFPTAQPKPQLASAPAPAPAAGTAEVEDLRRRLGAAKADLSCQAAILESLAAKLKDSEQQRTALIRQLADAVKRGDNLQAILDTREQERANALREQQEGHEAIVAELLRTANDQQAEYQALIQRHQLAGQERANALREQQEGHEAIVAELLRTANDQQAEYQALIQRHQLAEQEHANALREQQAGHEAIIAELLKAAEDQQSEYQAVIQRHQLTEQERADALREQQEGHEALVAELLKAAEDQQAQYRALFVRHEQDQSRLREMAEQLEAAEARSVAQQDRYRALRHETEKLMRMIDAAAECGLEMEGAKVAS